MHNVQLIEECITRIINVMHVHIASQNNVNSSMLKLVVSISYLWTCILWPTPLFRVTPTINLLRKYPHNPCGSWLYTSAETAYCKLLSYLHSYRRNVMYMQISPQSVLTAWCPFLHCHWIVIIINSRPLPLLRWLIRMTGCVSYPYPLRMTSLTSEGRSGLMCGPTPPSKKIGGDCLHAPVMICPKGEWGYR